MWRMEVLNPDGSLFYHNGVGLIITGLTDMGAEAMAERYRSRAKRLGWNAVVQVTEG